MSSSRQNLSDGYVPLYHIRTDLALEAQEVVQQQSAEEIPGLSSETLQENGIAINRLEIESEEASQKLGKSRGRYLTFEVPGLRRKDAALQDRLSEIMARELVPFLQLPPNLNQSVLVVGLGNWNVTPDSLGPKVIEELLVTRHAVATSPKHIGGGIPGGLRPFPSVLGTTG